VDSSRESVPRQAVSSKSLMYWVVTFATRVGWRFRGLLLKVRLRSLSASTGKCLTAGAGVRISIARGGVCRLGDRVSLGDGVTLSVGENACLVIGDDVRITHYTLIAAESSILINDRAQIGELCSVRDHEHDTAAVSMHAAPVVCSAVHIGEDAWIGRGVAILRSASIGAGAVIGANAVVRSNIPQNAVAVGIPARVVRMRESSTV
jgi:acetyltransferase-like isoleucine patch superfamily enzyme